MESSNSKLRILKDKANGLPLTPGVYIMKNKSGNIIYIGKAVALKKRVTQYFGAGNQHTPKVQQMVLNVDDFDFILCDTEFEAFILENSLIKQYKPKYNILLKDDKGFHYIKVTNEKWRRLQYANTKNDNAKYIGPYNSGTAVKSMIDDARKIFKLPDCNRSFDKKSRPCLNYHIGNCDGPCLGKITLDNYNEAVNSAISFLIKGGYSEKELNEMEVQMHKAADNLEFELAAKIRNRISAAKKIADKQKVITSIHYEKDVIGAVVSENQAAVVVLKFRNGKLCDRSHYFFNDIFEKSELYYAFLQSYYNETTDIPKRIEISDETYNQDIITKWLSEKSGKKVTIGVPKSGEPKSLSEMCLKNAAEILSEKLKQGSRQIGALDELVTLLGLKKFPKYIESYDISNTAGQNNVAGMIVFKNGVPLKRNYRRFKIKSFIGQDDYRSMSEVLNRRLNEYVTGKDEAFSQLPDLILLDGGKGQLSAVLPVIKKYNLDIPVFGMVKDSKHKSRAITAGGEDISIKSTRKAYTLLTAIQDEVHRYAISYHRASRTKSMLETELTNIKGIGKGKAKALILNFKTVKAIKQADAEALQKVNRITKENAEEIIKYFKEN